MVADMGKPSRSELMSAIWQDIIRNYFQLSAMGRETGAVTAGGGVWGILHTLMTQGPATVPEIARMRPVSRQHIQTLANEMVANGLAEFVHNPRHRRSKILQITDQGRAAYTEQSKALTEAAKDIVGDLSKDDLDATRRVLAVLEKRLRDRNTGSGTAEEATDDLPHRQRRRRTGMHAGFRRRHRDTPEQDA